MGFNIFEHIFDYHPREHYYDHGPGHTHRVAPFTFPMKVFIFREGPDPQQYENDLREVTICTERYLDAEYPTFDKDQMTSIAFNADGTITGDVAAFKELAAKVRTHNLRKFMLHWQYLHWLTHNS